MRVHLRGVRGSHPTPGPSTISYGGNTTCVSVEVGDDLMIVLDAGSGIRGVGAELWDSHREVALILTHLHWDHIQGLPFFAPLYQSGRPVSILVQDDEWPEKVRGTMDGCYFFPMGFDELPADISFTRDLDHTLNKKGVSLRRLRTNHPGLCYGYRLEASGRTLVFLPDNELSAPNPNTSLEQFAEFCQGADLLIHDCQYAQADMPEKRGWGHSIPEDVCQLASQAGAQRLILFHHDPSRTDAQVDLIEAHAKALIRDEGSDVRCSAGREGMVLDL